MLKLGEREVLARCPLTGTLGSGAFTATEHSPPVPTWPQGSSFLSPLCRVLLFLLWSKGHYLHGAGTAGTSTSCFEAGCLYGTGDPLSQPPQCWEYR